MGAVRGQPAVGVDTDKLHCIQHTTSEVEEILHVLAKYVSDKIKCGAL